MNNNFYSQRIRQRDYYLEVGRHKTKLPQNLDLDTFVCNVRWRFPTDASFHLTMMKGGCRLTMTTQNLENEAQEFKAETYWVACYFHSNQTFYDYFLKDGTIVYWLQMFCIMLPLNESGIIGTCRAWTENIFLVFLSNTPQRNQNE